MTQFLGALNDNFFRTFIILIAFSDASRSDEQQLTFLAASEGLFILPYILFSTVAGSFADRFSKSTIIRLLKLFELLVALVATFTLWTYGFSETGRVVLIAMVFGYGLQSAVFSPAKYDSVPELVPAEKLSFANGILELGTFLAITLGTVLGTLLALVYRFSPVSMAFISIAIAVVGLGSSFLVRQLEGSQNAKIVINPLSGIGIHWNTIVGDRRVLMSLFGLSFFWSAGLLFRVLVLLYSDWILKISDAEQAKVFMALSVGLGLGCLVAGIYTSGRRSVLVAGISALLLGLECLLFRYVASSSVMMQLCCFFMGFWGGMIVVPLNVNLQAIIAPHQRASIIGIGNFLAFFVGFLSVFSLPFIPYSAKSSLVFGYFSFLGVMGVLVGLLLIRFKSEPVT